MRDAKELWDEFQDEVKGAVYMLVNNGPEYQKWYKRSAFAFIRKIQADALRWAVEQAERSRLYSRRAWNRKHGLDVQEPSEGARTCSRLEQRIKQLEAGDE